MVHPPFVDSLQKSIVTRGLIHVGQRMDLAQQDSARPARYRLEEQQNGTQCLNSACGKINRPAAHFCGACGGPLNGHLYLQNDGLRSSYVIFGDPGSGKTRLMFHLLSQVFAQNRSDPERKFGGLIFDSKGALINDIRRVLWQLGREDDLLVINTEELTERCSEVNIIDCALEPEALGSALVLAAQSAGIGSSDPYWFQAMSDLFGAVLRLLKMRQAILAGTDEGCEAITLRKLLDVILETRDGKRSIESLMDDLKARLNPEVWSLDQQRDAEIAFLTIERHLNNKDAGTVEQFMSQAFKLFQLSKYQCYSPLYELDPGPRTTCYDQIIEEGRIVLVSLSSADELIARQLGSLIKGLFQKTVLSRLLRCNTGDLRNTTRPLILAADEYGRIASETPGIDMGDGAFLNQAYGLGCMVVLVTQSMDMLEATPLRDHWRSVFSNVSAKIFMHTIDTQTAKEACNLAGYFDWQVTRTDVSQSKEERDASRVHELHQRENLPTEILTQTFHPGDALVLGSLDGSASPGRACFIRIPHQHAQ